MAVVKKCCGWNYGAYALDVTAAMFVFLTKRILIIIFCEVHQHGRHVFCYSDIWRLSEYTLYTLRGCLYGNRASPVSESGFALPLYGWIWSRLPGLFMFGAETTLAHAHSQKNHPGKRASPASGCLHEKIFIPPTEIWPLHRWDLDYRDGPLVHVNGMKNELQNGSEARSRLMGYPAYRAG